MIITTFPPDRPTALRRLQDPGLAQGGVIRTESGADRTPLPAPVPALLVLRGNRVARGTEMIVVVDVRVTLPDGVPWMDLTHGPKVRFGRQARSDTEHS